ncbi:MAG: Tic20 family protein [Xenococcaceae cyanobacterium]
MTWRSSTDAKDRIFATLVYLFALYDAWRFGGFLLKQFPILNILSVPLIPIAYIYDFLGQFVGGFAEFLVFLILFFAVVRNERIIHFVRFNTIQTILIGILLSLLGLIMWSVLLPMLGRDSLLIETLSNVIFLAAVGACGYSMFQSALGLYAEIPTISNAAYSQVR